MSQQSAPMPERDTEPLGTMYVERRGTDGSLDLAWIKTATGWQPCPPPPRSTPSEEVTDARA